MKKRNPQDTTLRNTRAATKWLIDLERRIQVLEQRLPAPEVPKPPVLEQDELS